MSAKHMRIQSPSNSRVMRFRVFCKVAWPYLFTFIFGCLLLDCLVYLISDITYAPVRFMDGESIRTFFPNPEKYLGDAFELCFWLLFALFMFLSLLKLAYSKAAIRLDDGFIFLCIMLLAAVFMINVHSWNPTCVNRLPSYFGNNLARLEQTFCEGARVNDAISTVMLA